MSDMIEIQECPGWAILTGGTGDAYARELARCATMRHGHPWVSAEHTDAQMLRAIRAYWAVARPGWLSESDAEIIALHAHSAISHHLPTGCYLLSPDQVAALRALESMPGAAERRVLAYLGYSSQADVHTLRSLVLTPGSALVGQARTLDAEAYDDDIERYVSTAVRGRSVVRAVIEDAAS